jgi:F0F1-type ATP synthase assembly protein I
MKRTKYQNEALWTVLVQFPLVIILSPLIGILQGTLPAASYVVGGLICVLPNFYLYRRVFAHQGAKDAKKIFKSLYWGEAIKIVLTAAGFLLAVTTDWVLPLWLFMGYITAQLSFALAPFLMSFIKLKNITRA